VQDFQSFWNEMQNQPINYICNIMSVERYKIDNQESIYFLTFTVVGWLDENPLKDWIADFVCDYLYRSTRNYCDQKGLLEIEFL
jgi:hypothetical protein